MWLVFVAVSSLLNVHRAIVVSCFYYQLVSSTNRKNINGWRWPWVVHTYWKRDRTRYRAGRKHGILNLPSPFYKRNLEIFPVKKLLLIVVM